MSGTLGKQEISGSDASPRDVLSKRLSIPRLNIGMLILTGALGRLLSPGALKLLGNIPLVKKMAPLGHCL